MATTIKKKIDAPVPTEELSRAFASTLFGAAQLVRACPHYVSISSDRVVPTLFIAHGDGGGYTEIVFGDVFASRMVQITLSFPRGVCSARSYEPLDTFTLLLEPASGAEYELLQITGTYETVLAYFDPKRRVASIPRGIGPKRQHRALAILRLMEDRFLSRAQDE